jgi:glyoxylase-like metal-dependent hydrolase (beta-lactamase superfamily II)
MMWHLSLAKEKVMTRTVVLGILFAAGVLSMSVAASQQPPSGQPPAMVVEVEKLKDNLYVMKGGGGNSAVFITADGVTVVDTKNPGWGQPLLDKIKSVTDKPVTRIINTHTHGDHVSGNVEFPATVDIVTHDVTKTNMEQMRPVTGLQPPPPGPNIFQRNNGRGLPKRTFKDRMTIGSGGDRVDLFYFGRAHTGGDAFVVFPALRVMHTGDAFHTRDLPIMDANNGGSGVEYSATLAKAAAATAKDVDTIINGHNPTTTTLADLRVQSEFIGDFVTFVQEAKKTGKTVDDVVNTWKTPAKYTGYATPNPNRVRADAQVVWDETK